MADESWVGQIGKELERIFRYLFSGIIVVGFARLSHPSWFCWVDLHSSQHVALLALLVLSVGSSWYVIHRYSIHQIIDWLIYRTTPREPREHYTDWLVKYVAKSMRTEKCDRALRDLLGLRSAQVIFLFIVAEAGLLFSLLCPDPCSYFGRHRRFIGIGAFLILIVALKQQCLGFRLDQYAVEGDEKGEKRSN